MPACKSRNLSLSFFPEHSAAAYLVLPLPSFTHLIRDNVPLKVQLFLKTQYIAVPTILAYLSLATLLRSDLPRRSSV